jgi:hypothetical protein
MSAAAVSIGKYRGRRDNLKEVTEIIHEDYYYNIVYNPRTEEIVEIQRCHIVDEGEFYPIHNIMPELWEFLTERLNAHLELN